MTKVTLDNVGSLLDATTAATIINDNSAAIVTAVEKTLSRDGTSPNQMESPLDMNEQQVLNLPAPATLQSPLRLTDLNSFIGGGTVSTVPTGGTTGQALSKASNANYDMLWDDVVQSVGLSAPADLTVSGSPVTGSGTLGLAWATAPTGTGAVVRATSPTLVTPNLGTPSAINLANATNMNISNVSGLGTNVAAFLGTPSSANLRAAVTDESGTGALLFAGGALGTPASGVATNLTGTAAGLTAGSFTAGSASGLTSGTLPAARTNGHLNGEPSNGNAAAGEIGEYIESVITNGSPVAAGATNVAKTLTSISLTAGDWDVSGVIQWIPLATTVLSSYSGSISLTTNAVDITNGRFSVITLQTGITGAGNTDGSSVLTPCRFSLSGTTTIFLVGRAAYTTAGLNMYGILRARRVR